MAGRPKKYHIHLSDKEYKALKSIIRKKDSLLTVRRRCQIILDLDEDHAKMLTYEQCYKSNGTCSIFAFIEPLGGKHHVRVREHRTATDWAEEIRYLAEEMYSCLNKASINKCQKHYDHEHEKRKA